MPTSISLARAWIKQHRMRSQCIGVAVIAIVTAGVLGFMARTRLVPVRSELAQLRAAEAEIERFRSAFRPSQDIDARLVAPNWAAVALPRDLRVTLAEQLADRAEALGLTEVRVRFAASDSTAAPTQPNLLGTSVSVADYTIALECRGDLAAVLSLVNHLPFAVAVQRLTATRAANGTQYHLVLAVFESAEATHRG